ncbi:hypothetical protein COT50_04525, partial [candidate division WWE3 bacterium CG08_land_8_20_14_0_20_41_10]
KSISRSLRLNPLILAVWFMDDGSRSRSSVYFNTQQFCINDQKFLIKLLGESGLIATLNKDKLYYRIRLSTRCINHFIDLVKPYIIKSMEYKLPLRPRID